MLTALVTLTIFSAGLGGAEVLEVTFFVAFMVVFAETFF
jgi:hypothetical protein